MKKLTISCDVNGKEFPIQLFIGNPAKGTNPVNFQSTYLSSQKGVSLPPTIMKLLNKVKTLSDQYNISFEEIYSHIYNSNLNDDKKIKSLIMDYKVKKAIIEEEKKLEEE